MVFTARKPEITDIQACEIVLKYWGIKSCVRFLTSERDQNILVEAEEGDRYLLKLSHPDEDRSVSNLQTSALLHIGSRDHGLPVPKILPALDGAFECFVSLNDGRECLVRLMSFLEGRHVSIEGITKKMAADIGHNAARLDIALSGCKHPAGDHDFLWDTRKLVDLYTLLPHIKDQKKRKKTAVLLQSFCNDILPQLTTLPQQLIHNDLNLGNMLIANNTVSGIVDFGDMLWAQRVIDPANLCAYLIENSDDPFRLVSSVIQKYIETNPLTSDETAILPYLMMGRCLLTILITNWRASLYPEQATRILRYERNAYASMKRIDAFKSNFSDIFWEKINV
jgi:hydroxylysine kinase